MKISAESLGGRDFEVNIDYPNDLAHGDYASSVAFVISKQLGKSPLQIATEIVSKMEKPDGIEKIEVATPGFINFYLSREFFAKNTAEILRQAQDFGRNKNLKGKKVMVEYTDPNPFKEFHIGHLMSNAIGESISRLIEFSGAHVKRACYQGDVGLHVAKAVWGMKQSPVRDNAPLEKLPLAGKVKYLGGAYKVGAAAYESAQKEEIEEINKKIYDRSDSEINKLYDWGRKVSLKYFDEIYKRLGTKFDFYFFESEMVETGTKIVREFLKKGIFEESEGATIFRAEKHNEKLHTRVFINSRGLPTYEAKELGLAELKQKEYGHDISISVTGNEVSDYFRVVLEALKQTDSKLVEKIKHISHGMLRLPSGKMSSRTGDVITAESLLSEIEKLVEEKIKDRGYDDGLKKEIVDAVSLGALKFSILKQNIGGDIIFDFDKSISFEGDSGPYLQYSYARAKSVLRKAHDEKIKESTKEPMPEKTIVERVLVRFPDVVEKAAKEFAPHRVVTYLVELASAFNGFYAHEQIVNKDDKYSPYKIALTAAFAQTMGNGLWLLGIPTPERM